MSLQLFGQRGCHATHILKQSRADRTSFTVQTILADPGADS